MKIKMGILVIALFLLALPSLSAQTIKTVTFDATNGTDTWIESTTTTNFGTHDRVFFGEQSGIKRRGLMNLTILKSGNFIPSGSNIIWIKIQFLDITHGDTANVFVKDTKAYPLNQTWEENTVAGSGANALSTGPVSYGQNMTTFNGTKNLFASFEPADPTVNDYFNITLDAAYAQGLMDGNLGIWDDGIIIMHPISESLSGDKDIGLGSSDHATAANKYVIYINYTAGANESDKTPLGIISYNLTSEGGLGCTNWNANKNTACQTSDTTPTVIVTINETGYCRIGISDFNYTDLGPSRECTGGPGEVLTCTLSPADEIIEDTDFIYFGCKDISNNENRSSTSGALRVSLLSREANARTAIESGIQNALGSGYTLYTDQKIYARNSADQQSIGVFDKVVKWMNKIWAFNFITGNDTSTTMFNITPVLYVLEMSNITNTTVNTTVYNFIQSTR